MRTQKDLSALDSLYDKKISCAFCEADFTTKKVRSRFVKPLRIDSDFAPVFHPEDQNNPLWYYITVCPICGFTFTEDFSKSIRPVSRENIRKEICDKKDRDLNFCGKRDFHKAVRTYKLAIYTAQLLREKHIVFANICLRLAWLYRGMKHIEEEQRFLKLALSEYEQSYLHSDFKAETTPEMQILYLVGELNRRLGNYQDSIKYFGTVIDHPDKSRYMKYVNLSREQWRLGVEEYKENKQHSGGDVS